MRRKKLAGYVMVITSLIMLSLMTPRIIQSISGYISQRIKGSDLPDETETETAPDAAARPDAGESIPLYLENESEGGAREDGDRGISPSGAGAALQRGNENSQGVTVDDTPGYEEPFFGTPEEEDAANQAAYADMREKLLTASEAATAYRQNFNPVYDELKSGIMSAFISGREDSFYEDIANYCFGRYNTTKLISMVRFDAITEDTGEKITAILEFFSVGDLKDKRRVPDLAYCSYNKKTDAFVFYTNAPS